MTYSAKKRIHFSNPPLPPFFFLSACNQLHSGIFSIPIYTFEFDNEKSQSNLEKHGIDFIDAQLIWDDPDFIEIQSKSDDEPRSLVIGYIT